MSRVHNPEALSFFPLEEIPSVPEYRVNLEKDPYRNWISEVTNWPEGRLPVEIDPERFDTVLDNILDAYNNQRGVFADSDKDLPHIEDNMPKTMERGGKDHASFHFFGCLYMRGGLPSTLAYKWLSEIYDERPDLFDCAKIVASIGDIDNPNDPGRMLVTQEIADITSARGMGFHNVNPAMWVEDAIRLQQRYDGDPRKIFDDLTDYEELLKRVMSEDDGSGFKGFREKMASMLAYYLMDDGLIEEFVFPPPVDFHVLRVTIATGMIRFPGVPDNTQLFKPHVTKLLREGFMDYIARKGVDPRTMSEPIWLLSKLLCSWAPGNKTFEPNRKKGEKGRSAVLISQTADPNNPSHVAAYDKSCRVCPVEEHCTRNIGATLYFRAGGIAVRGTRVRFPEPPQGQLF